MTDDVTQEVLDAEAARCAAVAAQDWDALEQIVGEDFLYTHSNGKTEDRAAWIAGIKPLERAIEHDGGLSARVFGDVALLSGNSVNHYVEPFQGDSHYGVIIDVLQVWVRRASGWQIVAQHGVKIAAKN